MSRTWPTGMIELADGVFAYVQAFRDEIARVTDKPVRLLTNSHHHVDHTMGNALFPEALILSHANARREQERAGKGVLELLRPRIPELVAEAEDLTPRLPDVTFDGEVTLHAAGRTIELRHLGRAHTVGDALVLLPDDRILFAGDVAFHYVTPLAFEGHIGGWIEVCDRVDTLPIDTIAPGHGPVGGKAELREMRGYLDTIRTQARDAFDAGRSEDDATGDIDLGAYATWAEPDRLPLNVGRLYQEFRGEI